MCILPTVSRKRIFEDWILDIDRWLRKFGRWAVGEVSELMIAMLGNSAKANGRDAGDLAPRRLSKEKIEIYKKMMKNEPFVVINKKWMFDLLGVPFA